ncbi:hypothetical protein J6590_071525 [Homalodisca vitripennis]|nr:hypothetical protein J6590_071525 [Homalodisca vitripennis]
MTSRRFNLRRRIIQFSGGVKSSRGCRRRIATVPRSRTVKPALKKTIFRSNFNKWNELREDMNNGYRLPSCNAHTLCPTSLYSILDLAGKLLQRLLNPRFTDEIMRSKQVVISLTINMAFRQATPQSDL